MPYANIDATLSAADMQIIRDAIQTILGKLPFLVNLTADERLAIRKTGPDSVSFVDNALVAAKNNPDILPATFGAPGFEKDVQLFLALTEINLLIASLGSQVDDTRLAVGGEAMRQASQVYEYVKTAAKMTPGLKPVAEQLSERFQRVTKKTTAPEP